MDPERWRKIEKIYHAALEREPGERAAFLLEACAGDDELRREAESLLTFRERTGGFMDAPAMEVAAEALAREQARNRSPDGQMTGRSISHYRVLEKLGEGGMGIVYKARDTHLDRLVAIKVLPAASVADPDRKKRFVQEAKLASSLNHPNIIHIYDIDTSEGADFIAMEYVTGRRLDQMVGRKGLPLKEALRIAIQVADALARAHAAGIVHRDLKPSNVMVTESGLAKVLDFGLAKLTEPATDQVAPTETTKPVTEEGAVVGTVGYMSPEQAEGKKVDARSDIFSFGSLLYEMLTGRRAFRRDSPMATLAAILREDPKPIGTILENPPAELERLIARCLRKDPERRAQNMADVRVALEELKEDSDSGKLPVPVRPRRHAWAYVGLALILLALAVGTLAWLLRRPSQPPGRSDWVQVTNLPDSVSQPALSSDGRMLTFVRGPGTFVGPGQIYVKMLPDGEPVELTHDNVEKMGPIFSPDGAEIAYTKVTANRWDTWVVPVLGGQPHLWLPNASGLGWTGKGRILFSEIKNNDIHMGIVAAEESRAGERDVYVPVDERGMAHRSSLSPDGKWVLTVEMDRGRWLPCRLVPMDGGSRPRQVGPPQAGCTSVAWSPDGRWMYLNSSVGGAFHIWRERFPDGQPEQITSGPSEEEGIAMAADGRSFITAVGQKQSSVWVHDLNGERQISLEGYSYDPKFTPDGKSLCYRILKGVSMTSDLSEVRIVDLDSGRNESLLPGIAVDGIPGRAYDISPDGREIIVESPDREGKTRLWLAPLDRSSPPRQIPGVIGEQPLFGPGGEIFFRGSDRNPDFAYRVHEDGTGLRKASDQPIVGLSGISPDGQWLLSKVSGTITMAFPLRGNSPVEISAAGTQIIVDASVRWSPDGRRIFIPVPRFGGPSMSSAPAYVVPLPPGKELPPIPPGGFRSAEDIAKLPGARLINELQVTPGPAPEVYAFVRETVQRNLYRIPLR
jgi:serine/threonine protein kinase/Tol biopolymer transport system component